MHDMRWSVKEHHGLGSVEPLHAGVFTVVQRFRSDLGLYVHLHKGNLVRVHEKLAADGIEISYPGLTALPPATRTPQPGETT